MLLIWTPSSRMHLIRSTCIVKRFDKSYVNDSGKSGYQSVKTGDVVIMETENTKRVNWPLARVIQVFPSKDGVIRSVKIRIAKNGKIFEFARPIQRLYMLESSITDIHQLPIGVIHK